MKDNRDIGSSSNAGCKKNKKIKIYNKTKMRSACVIDILYLTQSDVHDIPYHTIWCTWHPLPRNLMYMTSLTTHSDVHDIPYLLFGLLYYADSKCLRVRWHEWTRSSLWQQWPANTYIFYTDNDSHFNNNIIYFFSWMNCVQLASIENSSSSAEPTGGLLPEI